MTALLARQGFEVDAIDVFCGGGGSSQGIHAAGATVRAAVNHSALAIECHSANFPDTDHWQCDLVDSASPQVIDREGKKVGGHYVDPIHLPAARFAWFSPSCTHHSPANAKKVYARGLAEAVADDDEYDEQAYVNSERSRVTMSCVLRYVDRHRPEVFIVENVIEVTKWGPNQDGATFRWWMRELDNLGYDIDLKFLNSMFFPPCPQSRDRIYVVAWRKGNTAPDLDYRPAAYCMSQACGGAHVEAVQTFKQPTRAWMGLPRWGKYGAQYDYRCPACGEVVHPASWMALSAIDWSNLGPTLGEREKPLAPATRERVRRAVKKFWYAPPIMLPDPTVAATVTTAHDGGADRSRHAGRQLPTLSQRNAEGIATLPLLVKNYGGDDGFDRTAHLGAQLGSVTRIGKQQYLAAVVPNRSHATGGPVSGPVAPVMAGTVSQGVIVTAAGNTFTRGDYSRSRHLADQMFTQHTTPAFALAALPVLRGDHTQQTHASESVGTVSANGLHHGLVSAAFSKINGGPADTAWHHPTDPLNTVTGRDTHGLVLLPWIDQWRTEPALITEQLATVTTHLRHSLASIEPFEGDITDDMVDQVRFRMLDPDPELRRAMAFADEYILIGNKGERTSLLGNAVTPPVSAWLVGRCLDTLRANTEAAA